MSGVREGARRAPCVSMLLSAHFLWVIEMVPGAHNGSYALERRETRKVGQREEKRTREAGTKMQCLTWRFIPSEATVRKYNFICTLNVQTYALEMLKQILRKTNLPHALFLNVQEGFNYPEIMRGSRKRSRGEN